mgnify:FL=1
MKLRIQALYEQGGEAAWFQMMLNSEDLSELLTRAENTQQMYEQDRESLQKYARTIEEVQKLEDQYEQEKADFETMKEEYEAQQSNLQYQLDVTRANSADCENEIAYAQQQATEYANLLEQQQAEIEQLEAERIAAEEEARRQAEAEAAAAAAAQEAAQNGDNSSEDVQYDEDGNVVSGSSDGSSDYEYDEYGNVIDTDNTVDYNSEASSSDSSADSSSDSSSASSSSGSGSSVVSYATQFVGNPYVWGGTSLTSGADCSGFVQSVYANFGVSLPRTSYEQQNAGYEVSYADAQP